MSAFTLLTLNMHRGMGAFSRTSVLSQLRTAIRTVQADVVCLQEVDGGAAPAGPVRADRPDPDYEFMADSMWPQFAYGRNAVFPAGHMGNAVLSKFPIVSQHNHDVSVAQSEKRGILWCEIQLPHSAGKVHVVSVHLGLLASHRQLQLETLCTLIGSGSLAQDAALIVAGDFNDWRRQADRTLQRCGLVEAFVAAHGRHANTFPARLPCFPLDRIYTRNVRVDDVQVLRGRPWSHLSDHLPLRVRVTLPA